MTQKIFRYGNPEKGQLVIIEDSDGPIELAEDPLTGRTGPMQPGDSLREVAEADQLRLDAMIETRRRALAGDPTLPRGTIVWTLGEIEAEQTRIRELRNAAFKARDEAIETERSKHSSARKKTKDQFWQPWQERFAQLVQQGLSERAARAQISEELARNGHNFTPRTLQRRLRDVS